MNRSNQCVENSANVSQRVNGSESRKGGHGLSREQMPVGRVLVKRRMP